MGMLGLKIDVDTYWGMKNGVPCLLRILKDFNIQGTFFLSIGPDNSGRAALQLIKNPLFLKKMLRTNAAGLYGWKTALYGTLLPAPMIALSCPDLVRQMIDEGHEVQFHAWDHRRWQDELPDKSEKWIEQWCESGVNGFEKLTGHKPTAFGAPSWLIDDRVFKIIKKYRFEYLSCTRAKSPFIHDEIDIPEIPSDLPCFEEMDPQSDLAILGGLMNDGENHVLPVHAEVEGGLLHEKFKELLKMTFKMGMKITSLENIKAHIQIHDLKKRKYKLKLLPGRHSVSAV